MDAIATAFFLNGSGGALLALHWPGRTELAPVLLLPPLLEELNKSRRQLNLLARALHAAGHGVLLVDWFGTGDSDGELAAASWPQWQADVASARHFLGQHYPLPASFCAVRGGALLLPEHADCDWLLVAPIADGQQQLTQWLRLKLMAAKMAGDTLTSAQLQAEIDAGGTEIAGYWLAPALVEPMRQVRLRDCSAGASRQLIEIGASAQPSATLQPLIEHWSAGWQAVPGEAFWQTTEITVCPALAPAVVQCMAARAQVAA